MTRAIGAAIPVLLIAAYGIVEVLKVIRTALRQKSLAALAIAGVLIFGPIVVSNNNLVSVNFRLNIRLLPGMQAKWLRSSRAFTLQEGKG